MRRVAIVGYGALGALYGHAFSQVPETEIVFIADEKRAARLRQKPLVVNGSPFSYQIETPESAAGEVELMIFAVKYHHLPQALKDASSHVGPRTIFLSVMNGIDSEEMIGEAFGWEHNLYGVALGMDAVRIENRISYSTPGKLLFGRAKNEQDHDEDVRRFAELCDLASLAYEIPQDMLRSLWWKFMINVGINQVSAVVEAPYKLFQRRSHARGLMREAMAETILMAEGHGIDLHEQDIDAWEGVLRSLSPEGKTSMFQDVEAHRKTEVEMFAGKLLKMAERDGIDLPVNHVLFELIKAKEERYL
ncbi:MAG TPA: ketopantoate reductase family protein [Sediminispirochaeta sp.]|nr:ketopantoate reductase family protein [Sediminispirochaeta sp.]